MIVGAGGEVDSGGELLAWRLEFLGEPERPSFSELLPRLGRPSIGVVSDDLTKFEPAA